MIRVVPKFFVKSVLTKETGNIFPKTNNDPGNGQSLIPRETQKKFHDEMHKQTASRVDGQKRNTPKELVPGIDKMFGVERLTDRLHQKSGKAENDGQK